MNIRKRIINPDNYQIGPDPQTPEIAPEPIKEETPNETPIIGGTQATAPASPVKRKTKKNKDK